MTPDHFLFAIDIFATVVFATTGALVASRKQMDVFGFLWMACATGVGGGTLRDLLLGLPVFWVQRPWPLLICIAVAVILHFTAFLMHSRIRWIVWCDAFGLAFAATAGTLKALDLGVSGTVAVVMGMFSASVGGILRDVLAGEPSIILRREIYMTCATVGGLTIVACQAIDCPPTLSAVAGFITALTLRIAAIMRDLTLPAFRPRKGRAYPESFAPPSEE
ncbi:trimeric intracellular cation channel family protein [Pseudooceanicola sp. CBS1P-1]|uniref:Trimeric intracellular cation channel family protein n=1 Tax=Pseudooceanicola albus TaxID=2692189 RepID=A0A6L7G8K3_9RHOB|nr:MULTISPECIES: trimeric intracellular cation channel family protein [Pseudooceanicola]MBT9386447.1 trimeric intracellular cation channel family protein [Pseudooceanicola endophyticus]MXN20395.1 trimeric intracellular cation channel family protein [Pseudooceanicola albus]